MDHPESHWQDVWMTKTADQVSWFEPEPAT
jgi:hypothetical protein